MINYLGLSGLRGLIGKIKQYIKDTIQQQYSHTVIDQIQIIEEANHTVLNKYTIQCDLGSTVMNVITLDDISNIQASNPRKATWTKTAAQTGCYAGIFNASSTAGKGVLRLTIENTKTGETTLHYICFIEDTPSDGAFLFCTTCDWNFITKYKVTSLQCFLEVPDDFEGNISIECLRGSIAAGLGWYITQPNSDSDNTPKVALSLLSGQKGPIYNDGQSVSDVEFFTTTEITGYGDLYFPKFRKPFGKYTVDLIYDFGNIQVGDKISDSVINDVILHNLIKSYNSSIENYNSKITSLEARIAALEQ